MKRLRPLLPCRLAHNQKRAGIRAIAAPAGSNADGPVGCLGFCSFSPIIIELLFDSTILTVRRVVVEVDGDFVEA